MNHKPRRNIGEEIIESLKEAVEGLRSGKPLEEVFTCRRVEVAPRAAEYDTADPKQVRQLLRASQAIFAQFLGVSVQTVRAWEQGENVPSDIAKRFMDEIRHDPEYWRKRLREVVVPKKRKVASKAK
jgi:putative transcriptional regulator